MTSPPTAPGPNELTGAVWFLSAAKEGTGRKQEAEELGGLPELCRQDVMSQLRMAQRGQIAHTFSS